MATTPTNKPIPSEDPRDLKFNAGKIDEVVNSDTHYYTDRFGVRRFTIAGFQYTAEEAMRNYGYITMDSFEEGATLTLPNQTLRYEATGEYYRWDGEFPKTVSVGSTPETAGGIGIGAWVSVGDASLRHELEITNAIPFVRPENFGGVGDGVTDDTNAIKAVIATGKPISLVGKKWLITSTIEFPDGYAVDARSSEIVADTGSAPIFLFKGNNLGMHFTGSLVRGTAGAFMKLEGQTDAPTASNQYAKLLKLSGVHISSATIDAALIFDKAVRTIFIDSCVLFCRNGIISNGKSVEITIQKSVIYGATSDTDTSGIKITSSGGASKYSEGWHISDCTIDNFENTIDLSDIFVFTLNGGYTACNSDTGYAITVRGPTTTTHCRDLYFNGMFGGKVRFLDQTSGPVTMHARITGELLFTKAGTCLAIGANIAAIDISDLKIVSATPGNTAISVANGSANINIRGISTDATLGAGIVFNGESGSNCSISDFSYSGSGEALSLARPVKLSNVPTVGDQTLNWSIKYDYVSASKDVAVGSYINQLQMTIARYSKIKININLAYSGGAASNAQAIGITVPTGVVLPNGTNSMLFTLPATAGTLTMSIDARTTLDFKNQSFSIDNRAGNQLRILPGSHLSVSLDN